MTLNEMAGYLRMDVDTMIGGLKAVGILNADGSPKKKYIDAGYFYKIKNNEIRNYEGLKTLICEKLGINC